MAWDLWFEGRDVEPDEFEAWFLERAAEAWWKGYVQGATIKADGMGGSYEFAALLDAVEERFPGMSYEATYYERCKVSDALISDLEVEYCDEERIVTDHQEEALDGIAGLLRTDQLRGFTRAAGITQYHFFDEETEDPLLEAFDLDSLVKSVAERLEGYGYDYASLLALSPLEALMSWWICYHGAGVVDDMQEPYASGMKRLVEKFGFSG